MNGVGTVGVDVARSRQRGDDAPAQIGVHDQPDRPSVGRIVVQQRGKHIRVPADSTDVVSALT